MVGRVEITLNLLFFLHMRCKDVIMYLLSPTFLIHMGVGMMAIFCIYSLPSSQCIHIYVYYVHIYANLGHTCRMREGHCRMLRGEHAWRTLRPSELTLHPFGLPISYLVHVCHTFLMFHSFVGMFKEDDRLGLDHSMIHEPYVPYVHGKHPWRMVNTILLD